MLRSAAAGQTLDLERYHLVDLVLAPPDLVAPGNPFDVDFAATFRGPGASALTIPGFYDSEKGYVVRFSPNVEGTWHYESHSDVSSLDGIAGQVRCVPNSNPNLHGQLLVDREHPHHFVHEDGTRRFLMGYEANWLMMIDQYPSDLTRIEAFLDSITRAGFNMVTVNAFTLVHPGRWLVEDQLAGGIFAAPTIGPWMGSLEAQDYARMNPDFFRHYDRVMLALWERGLLAHLMIHVYNKGVTWPELLSPDDSRFWRYFVARYQAFPNVVWDPGKEMVRQPVEYVLDRVDLIRSLDGYGRVLTVHDPNSPAPQNAWRMQTRPWDQRKELADAEADFKSDQVHLFWYEDARRNYLGAQRPYVNIEYGYERGVEEVPTVNPLRMQHWREVLRRSWLIAMGGGYINYYYCNTAWTLFIPEPDPPGYEAHRLYAAFWESTRYWLLEPDNNPLGDRGGSGVYCRCEPGHEYVVFDEEGQGFDLTLPERDGPYDATWVNPVGGERLDAGQFSGGTHAFAPPWGRRNWSVLHVRAAAGEEA